MDSVVEDHSLTQVLKAEGQDKEDKMLQTATTVQELLLELEEMGLRPHRTISTRKRHFRT